MARIYIHIGIEKTGTTTLQAFLCANAPALRRSNLFYPAGPTKLYFEGVSHAPLAACLLPERPEFVSEARYQPDSLVLAQLRRDIDACGGDVILSSEQLSSRITSEAAVRKLAGALAGHEVKIVCYLRRQDELALAAYSTAVRCGRREPLDPWEILAGGWYYRFRLLLALWERVFGRDAMIVRKYGARCLQAGDIRRDFLAVLGIEDLGPFRFGQDHNASLDARQVEALRLLNATLPEWDVAEPKAFERGNRLRQLVDSHLPRGEPLISLLSAADRQRIVERFAKENRWVESRYLPPGALDDWFSPVDPAAPAGIRPLGAEELAGLVTTVAARLAESSAEVQRLQDQLQKPSRRRRPVRDFLRSIRRTAALSITLAVLADPLLSFTGFLLDGSAADALDLVQFLS